MMRYNKCGFSNQIFHLLNSIFMILVIVVTLFPFWYSLVGSLNQGLDYIRGGVYLWPRVFTLANYRVVFMIDELFGAYKITVLRTILGTIVHLAFTSVFAYALSRKELKGRKFHLYAGLVTMFFGGGLIPTYLLIKSLSLYNNFLVYIVPSMFSMWNVLIFQSFFRDIPESMRESAQIDGAGEFRIYVSLIVPLSKPVFGAIALFVGVNHWNSFFDAMMYTSSNNLAVLQLVLLKMIRTREAATILANRAQEFISNRGEVNSKTIQMATMIVATVPIIMVYPFLQKYFVKGVMVGAIKG